MGNSFSNILASNLLIAQNANYLRELQRAQARVYQNYMTQQFIVESPTVESAPSKPKDTNLGWLDERVNELRVKL